MKQRLVQFPVLSAIAGGLMLVSCAPAHAQNLETRVSSVEFKDASLRWALEMLFKADNTPSYSIDPSADDISIGALTLQNITVRNAISQLLTQNNFKLSRGVNGIYVVEPREPITGTLGEGDTSTLPGGGPTNTGPGNPFGGRSPRARTQTNPEILPTLRTESNAQTAPRVGGRATGTDTTEAATLQPPILVKHIYAGGIALLFGGSVIPTLPFVAPASAANSSNNGNNGNNGGQGGNSSFGGGGFGGSSGGFGGSSGGFGGSSGGFGGSSGGFGGSSGGFGGSSGGFGGSSGGFGGSSGGNNNSGGGFGGGFGF